MKKILVGVIGSGFIGPVHVEALRRIGFVEVVGVADADQNLAKAAAAKMQIPCAYDTWMDLMNDPKIEVVHICTPNHLHYEMAKAALLHGKHVVCEKPLGLTVTQGEELCALAKTATKVCAVNFNYRFFPLMHQVKAMIAKGELGEILSVCGSYQQDWLLYDTDYSWRIEPQFSGTTRAVADIGSHWCDMAQFLTGDTIERVMSDFAIFHKQRKLPDAKQKTFEKAERGEADRMIAVQTEDYASVLLRFAGGAHGALTVTQAAAGRKNRLYIEVCGTKASIAFDSERCNELWIGHRSRPNEVLLKDASLLHPDAAVLCAYPGGHNEGFADTDKQHFAQIYRNILQIDEEHTYSTFEDGLQELKLNDAIRRSAETERWETLR